MADIAVRFRGDSDTSGQQKFITATKEAEEAAKRFGQSTSQSFGVMRGAWDTTLADMMKNGEAMSAANTKLAQLMVGNFNTVTKEFGVMRGAWDTGFADMLRTEEQFSTASKTMFADMMRNLSPEQWRLSAGTGMPTDAPEKLQSVATAQRQVTRVQTEAIPILQTLATASKLQGLSATEAAAALRSEGFAAKEVTEALQRAGYATQELTTQTTKSTAATGKHTQNIHSMWSQSFLFFGVAMMVNSAIQQLALATGEKANPALMQFGRIMQEVSSGAMIGMMSGLGAAGMGIGALGGALMGFVLTAYTVDPAIVNLNKQLDSLANKDEAVDTLAKLTGRSKDAAQALMELTKQSPETAKALQTLVNATRDMSGLEKLTDTASKGFQKFTADVGLATQGLNDLRKAWDGLPAGIRQAIDPMGEFMRLIDQARVKEKALAEQNLGASLTKAFNEQALEVNKKLLDDQTKLERDMRDAKIKYSEDVSRANISHFFDIVQANREMNEQLNDLAFQRSQNSARALLQEKTMYQNLQNELQRADQQQNEANLRANQSRIDRLADIESQLADKRTDTYKRLTDREADIEWSHQQKLVGFAQQAAQYKDKYSDSIRKATRSKDDALDDLRYRMAEQSSKTRTYGEYLEINRRANHEQAVIQRRFQEQSDDAKDQLSEDEKRAQERMDLDTQEYNHQKELTEREYREAIEIAEREANQQRSITEREYNQQVESARRAHGQAYQAAQQRYSQELATFQANQAIQDAAMNKQHADILRRNKEKLEDAEVKYNRERQVAKDRYDAEALKINEVFGLAKQKLQEQYDDLVWKLNQAQNIPIRFGNLSTGGASVGLGPASVGLGPAGVSFDVGGIVPGPVGTPQVIVAHGGEEVVRYADRKGDDKPSGKTMSAQFIFQAPIYGVEDLTYTINTALDKWDRENHAN